jgi:hypothetical protein
LFQLLAGFNQTALRGQRQAEIVAGFGFRRPNLDGLLEVLARIVDLSFFKQQRGAAVVSFGKVRSFRDDLLILDRGLGLVTNELQGSGVVVAHLGHGGRSFQRFSVIEDGFARIACSQRGRRRLDQRFYRRRRSIPLEKRDAAGAVRLVHHQRHAEV